MPAASFTRRTRAAALLGAAAAAMGAANFARAATVNGTVAPGEYAATLATQTTPTGFGDDASELNQALANYIPGGNLELALTANLEPIGNGIVLFVDSKAGGGVANSAGHAFNQFGSISGARTQTWGADVDPGAGVTAPAGGASILAPAFNPDYALEIHNTGGAAYFINVIDLALPNAPDSNRDVAIGSAALDSGAAVTHQYTRRDAAGNPVDSGDVTSSFNNTNVAGVTDTSAAGAATATKGLELILESQFLARTPGHALRVLPFVTSADGAFLSNQFLPGLGAGVDNPGAANDPAGSPLFDARSFSDRFYLSVFVPTVTTSGDWLSGTSWSGGAAPDGAEHAARVAGAAAQSVTFASPVTLGFLELDNAAGATIGGGGTLQLNGGAGAAALFVNQGSHTVNAVVNVQSDLRVNVAAGAAVGFGGLSAAANRQLTKAGDGTWTLGAGQVLNGAGLRVDVQRGTLAVAANLGNALDATTTAPDVTVGLAAGGSPAAVNFGASQTLKSLTVHPAASVNVLPHGGRTIVANTLALAPGAKVNLADNNMVLKSATLGTAPAGGGTYTGVHALVQQAYNGGAWDGAGGLATAGADATSGLTTLAVATAGQTGHAGGTFAGVSVDADDVLVMYTYGGDTNFDGKLDADDYGTIDFNVLLPGHVDGYYNGDFNYDGVVNADDYGVIDFNILAQHGPLADALPAAASVTAVPEPAACAFTSLAAAVVTLRRRCRRGR